MARKIYSPTKLRGVMIALAAAAGMSLQPGSATASPPPEAAQVGYTTNTFSSNFTSTTVDLKNTKNRSFNWFLWDLYGVHADPNAVVLNSDGTVTLLGTSEYNAQLASAVTYTGTNTFTGIAFGGGAYFEAEMHFDPKTVQAAKQGWPSFWALSIEGNIAGRSDQWPGQSTGYVHSVETDFFEADAPQAKSPGYGGAMHDWYGVYNQTCGHALCEAKLSNGAGLRVVPAGTDFTQFHRYGFLWVPATATSAGYAKFYFDDQQLGPAQDWQLYTNQPPPAEGQPWAFGALDQQHQFLIIGTGPKQPLTVRAVNVWQANASSNLSH